MAATASLLACGCGYTSAEPEFAANAVDRLRAMQGFGQNKESHIAKEFQRVGDHHRFVDHCPALWCQKAS